MSDIDQTSGTAGEQTPLLPAHHGPDEETTSAPATQGPQQEEAKHTFKEWCKMIGIGIYVTIWLWTSVTLIGLALFYLGYILSLLVYYLLLPLIYGGLSLLFAGCSALVTLIVHAILGSPPSLDISIHPWNASRPIAACNSSTTDILPMGYFRYDSGETTSPPIRAAIIAPDTLLVAATSLIVDFDFNIAPAHYIIGGSFWPDAIPAEKYWVKAYNIHPRFTLPSRTQLSPWIDVADAWCRGVYADSQSHRKTCRLLKQFLAFAFEPVHNDHAVLFLGSQLPIQPASLVWDNRVEDISIQLTSDCISEVSAKVASANQDSEVLRYRSDDFLPMRDAKPAFATGPSGNRSLIGLTTQLASLPRGEQDLRESRYDRIDMEWLKWAMAWACRRYASGCSGPVIEG